MDTHSWRHLKVRPLPLGPNVIAILQRNRLLPFATHRLEVDWELRQPYNRKHLNSTVRVPPMHQSPQSLWSHSRLRSHDLRLSILLRAGRCLGSVGTNASRVGY